MERVQVYRQEDQNKLVPAYQGLLHSFTEHEGRLVAMVLHESDGLFYPEPWHMIKKIPDENEAKDA